MTTVETELAEARLLLNQLTSCNMIMRLNSVDVTQHEIAILKREIAFLEKVLARPKELLCSAHHRG